MGTPNTIALTGTNWAAACADAIFFLCTRLQEGVTAAAATHAGAIVGARQEEAAAGARSAAVYSKCKIHYYLSSVI
jgi:hypothetical protein